MCSKSVTSMTTLRFSLQRNSRKAAPRRQIGDAVPLRRPFWKLGDTEKIDAQLEESRHNKWGFIFYRCSYEDDSAWKHFTDIVRRRAELDLDADKGIDIKKSLELTFREDRWAFDGATINTVRNHFKAWVKHDEHSLQVQAITDEQGIGASANLTPRYMFVVHVDSESLQSVVKGSLQPANSDNDSVGYVNLVDSLWEPDFPFQCPGDAEFVDDRHENEDTGNMRVCLKGLHPSVYSLLSDRSAYYIFHKQPSGVFVW